MKKRVAGSEQTPGSELPPSPDKVRSAFRKDLDGALICLVPLQHVADPDHQHPALRVELEHARPESRALVSEIPLPTQTQAIQLKTKGREGNGSENSSDVAPFVLFRRVIFVVDDSLKKKSGPMPAQFDSTPND